MKSGDVVQVMNRTEERGSLWIVSKYTDNKIVLCYNMKKEVHAFFESDLEVIGKAALVLPLYQY